MGDGFLRRRFVALGWVYGALLLCLSVLPVVGQEVILVHDESADFHLEAIVATQATQTAQLDRLASSVEAMRGGDSSGGPLVVDDRRLVLADEGLFAGVHLLQAILIGLVVSVVIQMAHLVTRWGR